MGYPIFCCQSVATDFARGKRHDKQVPKSDDHIIKEDFRMDKYIFDETPVFGVLFGVPFSVLNKSR